MILRLLRDFLLIPARSPGSGLAISMFHVPKIFKVIVIPGQ